METFKEYVTAMKTLIYKSVLAGTLIGFVSCIFMICQNKIIGACLFSLGLIAVLILQANLYTGKIGYVNSIKTFIDSLIILVFNLIAAFTIGAIFAVNDVSIEIVSARFIDFCWYKVLINGGLTGIAIYLAVELYKKTSSLIPIILAVMGFILGGGYHVVADACYLGAVVINNGFNFSYLLYLFLVAVGNSIGSLFIRFLQNASENNKKYCIL